MVSERTGSSGHKDDREKDKNFKSFVVTVVKMVAVYHISDLLITLHVSFTNCLMLFPLAPATRGYFATSHHF